MRTTFFIIPFVGILYKLLALDSRMEYIDLIPVEDVPYLALVLCNNSKYFCTGTVVHKQYVLTSAQCFYDADGTLTEDDTTVLVVAGTNKLNLAAKDIDSGVAQIRQSEKLRVHDSYHFSENFIADLALILLQEPFEITNRTGVAPLNPLRHIKTTGIVGDHEENPHTPIFSCSVYGFGKIYMNESNVNDGSLKKQTMNVGRSCACLSMIWSLRWHGKVVTQSFVCEGNGAGLHTLSGFCSGDLGAPLVCDGFLRGIWTTAFNYADKDECYLKKNGFNECGDPKTMYVFTDLCYYSQWLSWYVPGYQVVSESCYPFETS